jgi:hypothetical protein
MPRSEPHADYPAREDFNLDLGFDWGFISRFF